MANTSKPKEIDITKTGPLGFRQLQRMNDVSSSAIPDTSSLLEGLGINDDRFQSLYNPMVHAQQDVMSPLAGTKTRTGEEDFWGNSFFDSPSATQEQFGNLSDIRAENQPWYSKLLNGIGKAGVLAGTTALETAGLLYGAGHSLLESAGVIEDNGKSWVQDLWDNPITNALQKVTELSEEYMPNYYTRDEQENPFGNIFTANFLGDKLLKNLGFMVGAFYGGIPLSYGIGKIGTSMVKGARAASLAERAGMASRVGELTAQYGDDAVGLEKALAREGLTEAERGKKILEGFDKIRNIAQGTRATTQTIGSLGSAINEGAIEALNNSKDWAKLATQQENDRYQAEIEKELGELEILGASDAVKMQKEVELAAKHEKQLAEIEKGRAKMGNADLLLNIPILMASNMYQLGKLYTRGFDSTRRQMGSLFNGHRLSGDLAKGTLKSDKTWKGALGTALLKSNTEGLEEYLQRAASDGAGNAVDESLKRFINAGQSEEAKTNTNDFIAGFGKAIATNLGNPSAWEEYMIGALSSALGMPVFGSQTKNAYMKLGPVGFAGGLYGNYKEYMDARDHENKVADYLNTHVKDYQNFKRGPEESVAEYLHRRVNDPKFKALYQHMAIENDYDKWLKEQLEAGDKSNYKDLEAEEFYRFLNAAASSGHLEEFKQLVGYNTEYSDEELEDIVKQTTREITPEQQRKADEDRKAYLEGAIQTAIANNEDALVEDYQNELSEVDKKLEEDNYQLKLEGPFIDRNGQMNATDPDKMREILTRNRENLLQGIDDYLKIRNDIDIESDGKLEDDKLELLTMMKGHILDYDKRSVEMLNDILPNLRKSKESFDEWKKQNDDKIERYQKTYDDAKKHWENVKNSKSSEEHKKEVEKKLHDAETKLKEAKEDGSQYETALELLDWILEKHETSASERVAEAKGHGDNIIERVKARFDTEAKRDINADELLMRLSNPQNTDAISPNVSNLWSIVAMTPGIDNATKFRVATEIADLGRLANKKLEYNNKIREFLGDPSKINEAYQQEQDRISNEEKDNKANELSLNIKNANSMTELDRIMREAYYTNSEIATAALEKAKQTSDETTKNFIDDYEKASNFYGEFRTRAQKLPEAVGEALVQSAVLGTAESEWDKALQAGVNVYDAFIEGLNEAAKALEKNEAPGTKEAADGLKQVLAELNAAKKAGVTNSEIKKSSENAVEGSEGSTEGEVNSLKGIGAILAAKRAKKNEAIIDDEDSLLNAIEKEVKSSRQEKGDYTVDNFDKLSNELKDRIQNYNTAHPDKELEIDFEQLLQRVVDEEIANDKNKLDKASVARIDADEVDPTADKIEGIESEKSKDMKRNQRVTFRSDYPTEFRVYTGEDTNTFLDYKVPYVPTVEELKKWHPDMTDRQIQALKEQLEAIQKLMKDFKAYDFVNKNYLGYVLKSLEAKGKNLPIYLLRSTDDAINSNKTNPITFLAIKLDDGAEAAIRNYAFGNNKEVNFSNEIRPVTINGERYHIVGVMTVNSQIAPEVSKAFSELQGELNRELNPQIEEAKDKGQPFVVSKLNTFVDTINTGRLEKRNDEKDKKEKVSLYDYVATQQGDSSRSTSSEWDPLRDGSEKKGSPFYFGTIVNGELNTVQDSAIRSQIEPPNPHWMKHHNGAVVMFVPKADGKLYPISVQRRTVDEWLNSTAYGTTTGEQLLSLILEGKVTNEYLGNIINYLRDIYNENSTVSTKMKAKTMLQKYFIFGEDIPIHFNKGEVTLQFEDGEYNLPVENFEDFVTEFFSVLAKEGIKFTLPSASIESVKGRDVIKSGIMEVGLRGFYNFNANFTVRAIDATGADVTSVIETSEDASITGSQNWRENGLEYDFGDGLKTYYVIPDATGYFSRAVDEEGNPVSDDILNLIRIIQEAKDGKHPSLKAALINNRYSASPKVKEFVLSGVKGFDNVFLINGKEQWLYVNGKSKVIKLSSKDGNDLRTKIDTAITTFISDNSDKIRKLKENESKPEVSVSMVTVPTTQGDTREVPGVKVDKKDIKVGDIIGYSGPETESIINYGTVEIVSGDNIVLDGAMLPKSRTYYRLDMSSKPEISASAAPVTPSTPAEGSPSNLFAGKTLDDLNAKNGGLEALLAANKKSPVIKGIPEKKDRPAVKGVWEVLQSADPGKLVDEDKIISIVENILKAPSSQKVQMLSDFAHKITCE